MQDAAVDLLLTLTQDGTRTTEIPREYGFEVGIPSTLVHIFKDSPYLPALPGALHVLMVWTKGISIEMMLALAEAGIVEMALQTVEMKTEELEMMDRLNALLLVKHFAAKLPAACIHANAYERVKIVSDDALVLTRDFIMDKLRPITKSLGEGGDGSLTTLRADAIYGTWQSS